jgi:hypothetical protein
MSRYWIIKGEDPNCDFGGYHYKPVLDYVECDDENVVKLYAKSLKGWETWGHGGSIEEITFKKVDIKYLDKKEELFRRKKEIQAELNVIEKELK